MHPSILRYIHAYSSTHIVNSSTTRQLPGSLSGVCTPEEVVLSIETSTTKQLLLFEHDRSNYKPLPLSNTSEHDALSGERGFNPNCNISPSSKPKLHDSDSYHLHHVKKVHSTQPRNLCSLYNALCILDIPTNG